MKCPRDGTPLAKVNLLDLELDKCHKCDGIWFDPGELERLRDLKVEDVEEILEQKYGDPEFEEGTVDDYMRGPRCSDARLQRQGYTYVNPVNIDRCEKCRGIWIDDGELNAIIGEKKGLDEATDAGKLGTFLKAIGRFTGRR
jgi:Zn-finger nucleic acid-binding protein